ncbi:glia-derived nexin-like [Salmo trutta]|uniref:Serpin peptidase inhibitor, clade E (nexin, plasminogen activator inhibitor type 1), member 2 n=1 Tax=Salmo trutta TaxID=8032 RepID=A0A673WI94_SALTR|nr:glia-derived nexin-like [Salmo trutta]XP_029629471.1 glia-derived nexin-like [Salmo trutta]XP_029629472.1 glia-derived nexin-like [Salmo trutta]XP_029629473.1 glia-derived nexin-like [Salmo trutta]XP_029629474.1 glia-derived nexin-like [Salmo trutta]
MGLPSLLCMCMLVTLGGHRGVISQAPSTPSYGERGSDLGLQVFQQVARSRPQENVVLSPHGVASILGMLLPGAHGETRRQLLTALRYKKNGPYKMLRKLHKTLTAKSNQDIVTIANAMFSQQGFPMEEAFMSSNRANFQCESRTLDFTDTQAAAATINIWVNNQTKGHIPTLVKADMLDGDLTRLVAVNAIYFKGLWKSRFQTENTKMRTFNAGDGNSYKVSMMSQLSVFNIGLASTPQGLNYKVIELPYHGNSISMLIALPSEEDTPLGDVIPHINTATVQSWTKLLHHRKVRLLLPKFTAEAEVDLQASLSALGITDIFDEDKADFRHLSTEPVYISKALQKAKIEINEDGTKAAAVTTAILMARSSPPWVIVDRPFLFLIRHNPTGTILFIGQVNQP